MISPGTIIAQGGENDKPAERGTAHKATAFPTARRAGKPNETLCDHPLMEPIMTPFTKYFCRKGYTHTMGTTTTTMVAMRSDSAV